MGAALLLATVGALVPAAGAHAAAGPTITNPTTTRVNHGLTFTVTGTAPANATVLVHYHKQGTPISDYSIVRSVVANGQGAWSRTSTLDTDYRVYASVGTGNPHSTMVLFTSSGATPPRTTNPASAIGNYYGTFTFAGTAAPGVPVVIHYRRSSAPNVDIARTVTADAQGRWSREAVLDEDYSMFGTVGTSNPHTATVRYLAATIGDTLDIDYAPKSGSADDVRTTLGSQLREAKILDDPSTTTGNVRVEIDMCVRNRGPESFDDDPSRSFALYTASTEYAPSTSVGEEPSLDLSSMAVNELRCGAVVFDVPDPESLEAFAYYPGDEVSYYAGVWQVLGPQNDARAAHSARASGDAAAAAGADRRGLIASKAPTSSGLRPQAVR